MPAGLYDTPAAHGRRTRTSRMKWFYDVITAIWREICGGHADDGDGSGGGGGGGGDEQAEAEQDAAAQDKGEDEQEENNARARRASSTA